MDFKNFISKLFSGYPQSQKLESPLNDPFFYDEFGTIKEYEKIRDTSMEQVKIAEKQKAIVSAMHLAEGKHTEEQEKVRFLETQLAELNYRVAWQDYHSVNQHIQISKTIVGLAKVLTPIVTAIPDPKVRKQLVKLVEYLPILNSIDQKLNKFADKSNETKQEQK